MARNTTELASVVSHTKPLGGGSVMSVHVDLSAFDSIRSAVNGPEGVIEALQRNGIPHIDVVVANAGLQMSDRLHTTTDGIESTFGVNVVANHLLLSLLRPALATDAHIVVVGSGTHFGDPITRTVVAAPVWESPSELAKTGGANADSPKAGQRAYSTSKLGVNYLVHELNRRWPSIRSNIYDPGLMPATGLARDLPKFKQWAWNNVMPALKVLPGVTSTTNSSERLARLALGEEHADVRNAYIEIGKLSQASKASNDPTREADLWEYCERVTTR
jgi:NAD(P)-dependent dehydrogenase (short-subunit alcohol dehydrogenase family)